MIEKLGSYYRSYYVLIVLNMSFVFGRLFERAISFVGKDYFCHVLWDKYMKYEFSQEGWSFLAQSYIWALRCPTKKLQLYYDK